MGRTRVRTLGLGPARKRTARVEMHQVRYFLAVARLLNFTRAAEECNVTQPSLTRAIQKLEDEFGGLLFRRERALTHLTELGRMMLPHLEQTYAAAQTAKALARGLGKEQQAPLAVGIARPVMLTGLAAILEEMQRKLTGLSLDIVEAANVELLDRALHGSLELIIIEQPPNIPERCDAWPLYDRLFGLFANSEQAQQLPPPPMSTAVLAARNWIGCRHEAEARLVEAALAEGQEIGFRHSAADSNQAAQMVAAGLGLAVLPLEIGQSMGLTAIDHPGWPSETRVMIGCIAGRKRSMAAEAFLKAARALDWHSLAAD